jgi:hypothetical protein
VGDRVNVSKVNDGLTVWSKLFFPIFLGQGGLLTLVHRLARIDLMDYRMMKDKSVLLLRIQSVP